MAAPRLRVGEETGRHATWLELFFDLVFVVAIAALAGLLHDDLSLGGFFARSRCCSCPSGGPG